MNFRIGQPVRRHDDDRPLRGEGRFLEDISLSGQAHGAVLRSPVAHGRIATMETAAARAMPDFLAVWTDADTEHQLTMMIPKVATEPLRAMVTQPHLARATPPPGRGCCISGWACVPSGSLCCRGIRTRGRRAAAPEVRAR